MRYYLTKLFSCTDTKKHLIAICMIQLRSIWTYEFWFRASTVSKAHFAPDTWDTLYIRIWDTFSHTHTAREIWYFHLCFYFVNFSYNTNKTFKYKTWAYGCVYLCYIVCLLFFCIYMYVCRPMWVCRCGVVCEMKAVMCLLCGTHIIWLM